MEQLESLVSYRVFLYVDLDALPCPLQMGKARLAHQSDGNDAAGDAHFTFACFQLWPGGAAEFVHEGGGRIRPAKFAWIRIVA